MSETTHGTPPATDTERATARERLLAENGWTGARRTPLAADASFRHYVRLDNGAQSVLLMDAPPGREDVRPFVAIARHLIACGLSAPKILAEDTTNGFLLIEDFGDATFTRLIAAGADETALYHLALEALLHLHGQPATCAAPAWLAPYDRPRLIAEAALLADWFLPAIRDGQPLDNVARTAYDTAWNEAFLLLENEPPTLVLRDFHVDNLMRIEGRHGVAACGLLDFQDAVTGPAAYDLISLLEDARRDVPETLAADCLAHYMASTPRLSNAAAHARFVSSCAILAAQRHTKVIGIFTRLAVRDDKPLYLKHIPRVWRLLERALDAPALTPVAQWFNRHISHTDRRSPPWPPANR